MLAQQRYDSEFIKVDEFINDHPNFTNSNAAKVQELTETKLRLLNIPYKPAGYLADLVYLYNTSSAGFLSNCAKLPDIIGGIENVQRGHGDLVPYPSSTCPNQLIGFGRTVIRGHSTNPMGDLVADLKIAYNNAVKEYEAQHCDRWHFLELDDQIGYFMAGFFNLQNAVKISHPYDISVITRTTMHPEVVSIRGITGIRVTDKSFRWISDEPPMLGSLLTTAITLVKLHATGGPSFSLEPNQSRTDTVRGHRGTHNYKSFRNDSFLLQTLWGQITFEADLVLKNLSGLYIEPSEIPEVYYTRCKHPIKDSLTTSKPQVTFSQFELGNTEVYEDGKTVIFGKVDLSIIWNYLSECDSSINGYRIAEHNEVKPEVRDAHDAYMTSLNDKIEDLTQNLKIAELYQLGRLFGMVKYIYKHYPQHLENLNSNCYSNESVQSNSNSNEPNLTSIPDVFPRYHYTSKSVHKYINNGSDYKFSYTMGGVKIFANPYESARLSATRISTYPYTIKSYSLDQQPKTSALYKAPLPYEYTDNPLVLQCAGLLPIVGPVLDTKEACTQFSQGKYTGGFTSLGFAVIGILPGLGALAKIAVRGPKTIKVIRASNLVEQMALQSAKNAAKVNEGVFTIGVARDASRLSATYGPGNWVKMHHNLDDAKKTAVHWYRETTNNLNVEFKLK